MSPFWCPACGDVPEAEVEFDGGDPTRATDDPTDGFAAGYSHWPEGAAYPHVVQKRLAEPIGGPLPRRKPK